MMDHPEQQGTEPEDPLIAELRRHYAADDPIPGAVDAAARAAFELRDLDGQIAELLRDSALDGERELAGVRGDAPRSLTFACGASFIEVDVEVDGAGARISGYVAPGGRGVLTVEHGTESRAVEIDERGRFRATRIPATLVRLRVAMDGFPLIRTPWMPL